MSAEGKFEKTRIQDPDKAHEVANMVKAQAEARGEKWGDKFHYGEDELTTANYDEALAALEQLEDGVHSPLVEKSVVQARNVFAGISSLSDNALNVLGWSLGSLIPLTEHFKEEEGKLGYLPRQRLVELLRDLGEGKLVKDYEKLKVVFSTAHETLVRRRAEAEEITKR